jgi:hypothetical protein
VSDVKPVSILRPLVEELAERRERAKLGGGEERIARQHDAGKLTARERIALLIDDGTFTELGIHAGIHHSVRGLEGKEAPADGVITGYGRVDGRLVAVAAYDFTVMAGSMGMTGEMKVTRLRDLALTKRMPFVWLLDSAGARIQEAVGSLFAGSGHLFREEVVASGVIPQVAALMGPCAAGTAAARWRLPGRTWCARRSARTSRRRSSAGPASIAARAASGTSRWPTTRSASPASGSTSRSSRRTVRSRHPRAPPAMRSTAWTRSCSTSCPSPTASPTTCTT